MSESPIPPPPPPPPVAKPDTGFWWFIWILCTVIAPGIAMTLVNKLPGGDGSVAVCVVAGLAMPILHIISSIKVSQGGSGCLRLGLIFGGWVLMLACFFVGCVVMLNQPP